MHEWYPFLEGYSPKFVESVLRQFAPTASAVIDPFAGVGTTPITAARMGLKSYYCELNPLLQYLIETKAVVLSLDANTRARLAGEINDLRRNFARLLADSQPDFNLHCSYYMVFGKSRFFDEKVFENVLRARCLVDWVRCEKPLLGTFLEWAIVSSLVPASRLIRRGDLRFKNEDEMKRPKPDFLLAIDAVLRMIAADIQRIQTIPVPPECLCQNARRLSKLPPVEADCVITSPPYLNGTNYFRNTKVELWFIRALRGENDLRVYRDDAVTAGINDVILSGNMRLLTPDIEKVVADIQSRAYDPRIPRMVADYFADMGDVFSALHSHLEPGSCLAIDIGDSRYNDVHVPTDRLLAGVLADLGYEKQADIVLRQRCSRNGQPLKQVLLVFAVKRPLAVREKAEYDYSSWIGLWREFKKELPHHAQPYCKRNWGHPLHSLCSYQGKLKPALAHFLVNTFVPEEGTILDPFAGVGTISLEAALSGRKSWSFDISPAALAITKAKLSNPSHEECFELIRALSEYLLSANVDERDRRSICDIHFNGRLQDYFHPRTLKEVLLARRFFLEQGTDKDAWPFVLSALLHILHGNRPYALSRRSHPIMPFAPTGPAEYRPLIPRLESKVHRAFADRLPSSFVKGVVYDQDVTTCWPSEIRDLDTIVTSPPFFDSTRFFLANWMRLWFCGWDARDFKVRPLAYIDERQKRDMNVYRPFFRQARERLQSAGLLVLHLGKSRKCDMAKYLQIVARPWFRVVDLFEESVAHCESHGIADKGTVEKHQFLVMG
ncbi:MAG: DNA methyltransferase [Verrucomicrobiota bacterium]|nr:DNA methyltransferase [Verrucomicrobiota bacterium]